MKPISWKRIALTTALVLGAAAIIGLLYWTRTTLGPSDTAMTSLTSDGQVRVTQEPDLIVFEPVAGTPSTGFVLYPGGGVDHRAYAPVLRRIAARGFVVVLPAMPLNLAFFRAGAADRARERLPTIDHWVVGGHSLGGVVAAGYAAQNPSIDGMVFWASYPSDDALLDAPLAVLSIFGSRDGLATPEEIDDSRRLLPSGTQFVEIEGGNHAQFGSYGQQAGDQTATISPEEQWAQIVEATAALLDRVGQ